MEVTADLHMLALIAMLLCTQITCLRHAGGWTLVLRDLWSNELNVENVADQGAVSVCFAGLPSLSVLCRT